MFEGYESMSLPYEPEMYLLVKTLHSPLQNIVYKKFELE